MRSRRRIRATRRTAAGLVLVALLAACDITAPTEPVGSGDPDPTPNPESPTGPGTDRERTPTYALEESILLSGGTGVLVSPSFDGLILTPAEGQDPENPRLYSDLFVWVNDVRVGTTRIGDERIEFEVPVLPGGPAAVDLFSRLGEGSVSGQLVGLVASGHIPCPGAVDLSFTPLDREIYVQVPCFTRDTTPIIDEGIARLLPDIPGRGLTPVPASINPGDDPSLRSDAIAVGPAALPGEFLGPFPTADSEPPAIWRWQGGQNPSPVAPLDCGLTAEFTSGAVAETADGVCVALDFARDVVLRDGTVLADAHGATSIVGSADGRLALRGGAALIVLDAAGNVAFEGVVEAADVADVRFSPGGDALYVGRGDRLEVIDPATGNVIQSAVLSGRPLAIAVTGERLHVAMDAPAPAGDDRRLVIARLDPVTLEVQREVAVSPALAADAAGWPAQGESPLLLEDATGTRVLLVTQVSAASGIHVHAVDGLD